MFYVKPCGQYFKWRLSIRMRNSYSKLAYSNLNDFVYGTCPKPVRTKSGLVIGGGTVYPELNFTLDGMNVNETTVKETYKTYSEIINDALKRAKELYAPGVVLEYETLPDFTEHPEWAIEVNRIIIETMKEYSDKYGLKLALRTTLNDMREMERPPVMRSGRYWEAMLKGFEGCAKGGADFLSIESTGGKELHDDALVNAEIKQVIFSLGVLGTRDMKFLWKNIVDIAEENNCYAAGDSACGFANTAMVLAEKGFIPKSFAAVVRVAAFPRSLVAYEMGAVGPSKDCAYEGPYIKAITGVPIAMEGKTAACAHFSPIGNISAAVADLWSNESVQEIKLLSGMAPTVYMEQLIYDCRLMNMAAEKGKILEFRDLLVDSDKKLDVQAYVLRPDVVFEISKEVIKEKSPFIRTKLAAQLAVEKIKKAIADNEVQADKRDNRYLDMMAEQIEEIPDDEEKFYHEIKDEINESKFLPKEYELA